MVFDCFNGVMFDFDDLLFGVMFILLVIVLLEVWEGFLGGLVVFVEMLMVGVVVLELVMVDFAASPPDSTASGVFLFFGIEFFI